jgi:UDP-N-acetylmuramate--alanine ligase
MNFRDIKNIHFVGIGGIGMSGIAEILSNAGVSVSGCDLKRSASTDLLATRGIHVTIGHDPSHLEGVDVVVVTSAVKGNNPEIDAALDRGLRVMKRKEMLGQIVNAKRGIGVSGTHGKTSTCAMIATLLQQSGLDPTVLVGGMLRNFGTNAKTGAGDLLVVEADEYDRTFHELKPEIAVVTNIEADHLEYYGSLEAILESFRIFLSGVREEGVVIGCIDEPNVAEALANAPRRIVRYGLSAAADVRATNLRFHERGSSFDVAGIGYFKLFVPGEHNVRNALAAIAVGRELGLDGDAISSALAKYLGVDRRFQLLGEFEGALIVDDYAHHPTEVLATLNAARGGFPNRRLVALFQPHLYSRTRDFAREFGEALRVADVALVAPIFAAREAPLEHITSRLISDAVPDVELLELPNAQLIEELRRRLRPNDIFIAMGAGDVHEVAEALARGTA